MTSAIKSVPLSNTTCVGLGYLVSQVVSNLLAMISAHLVSIDIMSNQPVAGSIIVKAHRVNFLLLFKMLHGPMRLIHRVSQDVVSAFFAGNLPYLTVLVLGIWHVGHNGQTVLTVLLSLPHVKCWRIVCSVYVSPGQKNCMWCHCTTLICSVLGATILPLRHISLRIQPASVRSLMAYDLLRCAAAKFFVFLLVPHNCFVI